LRETVFELNRKFFVKPISFEGLQRIEKDEYPVAAVREILLGRARSPRLYEQFHPGQNLR
jgi:hypothetical protein